MSKIICDICGTAYPDTASQCPICGSAAGADNQGAEASVVENTDVERRSTSRGGRFTKSNVRKRTTAQNHVSHFEGAEEDGEEPQPQQGNKAVTIAVIVLLIAVVLVAAYIAIRFFAPAPDVDPNPSGTSGTSQQIPCTDLHVDQTNVTFREAGRAWLLNVTKLPGNTTDSVTYASSDESVATVTADGVITSVGGGEAKIIITCGSVTKEVNVLCDFEGYSKPTDGTTEPSADPSQPSGGNDSTEPGGSVQMELNKEDVSCSYYGQKVQLRLKGAEGKTVTWSSEDETIASVDEKGNVTALSPGTVEIYAECEGQKFTCIIRCSKEVVSKTYSLNLNDVTIKVGETLSIYLQDASGKRVQDVTWVCSEPEYVELVGNKFTGLKPTAPVYYARIYTDYEGERYTCIVRVRSSE